MQSTLLIMEATAAAILTTVYAQPVVAWLIAK
jgi:hypothetical protein